VDLYTVNPLTDPRWESFVGSHPSATVFHQRGWLEALAATYGYEPIAFCDSSSGEPLRSAVVFCDVSSWVTGTRLVSLPFSDHCTPLVSNAAEFDLIVHHLRTKIAEGKYRYIEFRAELPFGSANSGLRESVSFWLHLLDLQNDLSQIFRKFHPDCIQRKIKRAERERLSCDIDRSEESIQQFYDLLVRTRKRHRLLPQPVAWLKNLARSLGNSLTIRIAKRRGIPIAGLLSLRHEDTVVYKYGCSDERFHNLGAVPFLFWNLIQESKETGAKQLDFGRSDLDQPSLILFKERFGAKPQSLTYYRLSSSRELAKTSAIAPMLQRCIPYIPDVLVGAAGRIAYRHVG